jgi:hypothetical protein
MADNKDMSGQAGHDRAQSSFRSHASSASTMPDEYDSNGISYRDRALPNIPTTHAERIVQPSHVDKVLDPNPVARDGSLTNTPISRIEVDAQPNDVDKMLGPSPAARGASFPNVTPHVGRPTTHAELLSQHPIFRENPFSIVPVHPEPTGVKQKLENYLSVHARSDDLTKAMANVIIRSESFDVYPTQFDLVPTTATTMLINMKMELNDLEQLCLHVADDSLRSSITAKVDEMRKLINRTHTVITHGLVSNMKKALQDRDRVYDLTGLMVERIQALEDRLLAVDGNI